MPGMYTPGEYDLAGFAVGVVEKSRIIDGSTIAPGDVVLGLASDGAHSNGYSLIRKIIERAGGVELSMTATLGGQQRSPTLVLAPTRIYVKPVLALLRAMPVKGMAHITGGGLIENVPRVLADDLTARLDRNAWPTAAALRLAAARKATSPTTRCCACSTAASAWCSSSSAGDADDAIEAAERSRRDASGASAASIGAQRRASRRPIVA